MKRFLLASSAILLSSFVLSPVALAKQTHLNDPAADLNGDGVVTLVELQEYNRDQRGPK